MPASQPDACLSVCWCRVAGPPLFPAAAFFELGVAAGRSLADDTLHSSLGLHATAILAPCKLPEPGQAVPTLLCQLAGSSLAVTSCEGSRAPAKHLSATTASAQSLPLQRQQPGSWLPAVLQAAHRDLRPATGQSSIAQLAAVQGSRSCGRLGLCCSPSPGRLCAAPGSRASAAPGRLNEWWHARHALSSSCKA